MTFGTVFNWRLDALGFAALSFGAALAIQWWLRRRHQAPRFSVWMWTMLTASVVLGAALAERTGQGESDQMRSMLEGFAPTYAAELARLGHARVNCDTRADDPTYLALIGAEKQWLGINGSVSDIYTMGRRADGKIVLLVDSETDY